MSTIIHSNNQYFLINFTDLLNIINLNDIFNCLNNIYPKNIFSHRYNHVIIDTQNIFHLIVSDNSINLYSNIYKSTFDDPKITIISRNYTYNTIIHCINNNIKFGVFYYEEITLDDDYNLINYSHKNINNIYKIDLFNKPVLYYENSDNMIILDYFLKIQYSDINISKIKNILTIDSIYYDDRLYLLDNNNILYDTRQRSGELVLYETEINLKERNAKKFYCYCEYVFYVDFKNDLYCVNTGKCWTVNCPTIEYDNNTEYLGKILFDDFYITHIGGFLLLVNKNNLCYVDMDSKIIKYVDFKLNISFTHNLFLNNYVWNINTHKYIILDNNNKSIYNEIIKIVLLCNKQLGNKITLQGNNLKIPKYLLFNIICNIIN